VLTSERNLDALVGPAGTGKTHTMGAVARAWRAGSGHVMGLAVAETAARTLGDEAGIATVNTAKLLFEHRHRTAEQKARRRWQEHCAIEAGALVILDEAGMASRQVIDDVRQLCQEANAKLLLVGDHEQLATPTAGGMFALVVERAGAARLAEVRRFAADWERRASLRLRAGDAGRAGRVRPAGPHRRRRRSRDGRRGVHRGAGRPGPGTASVPAGRHQRPGRPPRRAGPRPTGPRRSGRRQPDSDPP
jgi:ATP-dependent exoDNAse (exonuclease V) alpha subunit